MVGPRIALSAKKVSLLVGDVQLAKCLKVFVGIINWGGTQASSDNDQSIVQDTVYNTSVSVATSDWCAVLSY